MEEEIRAQLFANQQMLADNAQSWEEKVTNQKTQTATPPSRPIRYKALGL